MRTKLFVILLLFFTALPLMAMAQQLAELPPVLSFPPENQARREGQLALGVSALGAGVEPVVEPVRPTTKPAKFNGVFKIMAWPGYGELNHKADAARKLLWASRAANWSALGYDAWTTREFLKFPHITKPLSFTYNNTYYGVGPIPGIYEKSHCGVFGRRNFGAIVACGAAVYVGWQIGSEKLYDYLDRRGSGKLYKLRWVVIGANFFFAGEHIRMGIENQRMIARQRAIYGHLIPGVPPGDLGHILRNH